MYIVKAKWSNVFIHYDTYTYIIVHIEGHHHDAWRYTNIHSTQIIDQMHIAKLW